MISGASLADVAVLVVSAANDEAEVGISGGGQTREHVMLVRSLGVRHVVVAVSKMDTVCWDPARYDDICIKVQRLLTRQAGFSPSQISVVPVSGYTGVNVVHPVSAYASGTVKSDEIEDLSTLPSWYTGPTLMQVISGLPPPSRNVSQPLRLIVSDVGKASSMGVMAGKIESGALAVNDNVLVLPDNITYGIKSLYREGDPVKIALAGEHIEFTFSTSISNIVPGYVLCDPLHPVPLVSRFVGQLIIFEPKNPITPGFTASLHVQHLDEPVIIERCVMSYI